MVAWSALYKNLITKSLNLQKLYKNPSFKQIKDFSTTQIKRSGDNRNFNIAASDWQWHKFKDISHLYLMVGLIPCIAVITYVNIFIGPAQLAPIPEDYEPEEWEYYRHPITRFLAKYVVTTPKESYEKACHAFYEEGELMKVRKVQNDVEKLMSDRLDYQAWYYRPATVKYARQAKEHFEELNIKRGQ